MKLYILSYIFILTSPDKIEFYSECDGKSWTMQQHDDQHDETHLQPWWGSKNGISRPKNQVVLYPWTKTIPWRRNANAWLSVERRPLNEWTVIIRLRRRIVGSFVFASWEKEAEGTLKSLFRCATGARARNGGTYERLIHFCFFSLCFLN